MWQRETENRDGCNKVELERTLPQGEKYIRSQTTGWKTASGSDRRNPEEAPPISGRVASERRKHASLGTVQSYMAIDSRLRVNWRETQCPCRVQECETLVSEHSSADRAPVVRAGRGGLPSLVLLVSSANDSIYHPCAHSIKSTRQAPHHAVIMVRRKPSHWPQKLCTWLKSELSFFSPSHTSCRGNQEFLRGQKFNFYSK